MEKQPPKKDRTDAGEHLVRRFRILRTRKARARGFLQAHGLCGGLGHLRSSGVSAMKKSFGERTRRRRHTHTDAEDPQRLQIGTLVTRNPIDFHVGVLVLFVVFSCSSLCSDSLWCVVWPDHFSRGDFPVDDGDRWLSDAKNVRD